MKYPGLFISVVFIIVSNNLLAQQKKDSSFLSNKDIVGLWQRDSKIIGNGLNQNFQFFADGNFILNLGNDADDMRNTIALKGKYRLDKDKLYFTILSKTIIDGSIGIADAGISLNIFEIENGKAKEVKEINPKEIADPCYISIISKMHIKINNEVYFKIK